ncbi:flagellar protein FliT [Salinibacter ruber]|uniref:flagellar protein FliT n=1 Tax=Salinibacter ruber TaxID=146919 RepID=UPI0021670AAB|nr:flagellar protein FliT [Salinibacter ruber]MCS3696421.1 chromosome segregation ATPase [Salinibacter ruber]
MSLERLDALLHLGERIAGAVEADDWGRVADLLDRRARMIERLGPADGTDTEASPSTGNDVERSERALRQKQEALAEQHEALLDQLREREDEIEAELNQLQRLQRANDSYDDHTASSTSNRSGHDGVLPPELSG